MNSHVELPEMTTKREIRTAVVDYDDDDDDDGGGGTVQGSHIVLDHDDNDNQQQEEEEEEEEEPHEHFTLHHHHTFSPLTAFCFTINYILETRGVTWFTIFPFAST